MALKKRKKTSSEELTIEVKNLSEEAPSLLIPTGSSLLNLACSDDVNGGYGAGKIVNLIGDSSSGKTILAWSMFAEVCRDKRFDKHRLIYDDSESALEINVPKLFGKKTDNHVERFSSDTTEDFYGTIVKLCNDGIPFIYCLDSLDALTSEDEQKRADEYADEKSNKSGSFKTEKPRMISEILRVIVKKIKLTNSFVLIISQTRDNIGFGAMFTPKTRSGGKALKFYCSHEIWLALGKKVKKLDREIGASVFAKVSKNKITGKRRDVIFPVYYDYGVDSIGSCVDFLIEEKHWKGTKDINAVEFDVSLPKEKLIKHIEEKKLQKKLLEITQGVWTEIENKLKLDRESKYD